MQRRAILLATAALCCAASATPAAAQEKAPLKILVGFPAGGSADTLARLMADGLRNDFSSIVVENKPGAGGRIALTQLKKAKPDGQTVLILPNGSMVLFPHLYKKLDYDPIQDFTPISLLASFQFGVVAGPGSSAKSIQDLISAAKSKPGQNSYGTAGQGTWPHLLGLMMEQSTGIELNHVPFQGGSAANAALLGSHVQYKFDVVSETAELHRNGKVRILAVTGAKRDLQVPEVPTLKELGIPMEASSWFAMYGPANLPTEVRKKLEMAVVNAVKTPELQGKLRKLGYEAVGSSSSELAASQKADLTRWEKPIKTANFSLD